MRCRGTIEGSFTLSVWHIKVNYFFFAYKGEDIKSLFLCTSLGSSWREDMLPVCLQLCRPDHVSGNKGKATHDNTEHKHKTSHKNGLSTLLKFQFYASFQYSILP